MTTSRSELRRLGGALGTLSRAARADFLRVWGRLDPTDWVATRTALEQFWPELIGHYGDMAATLGSDYVALQRVTPRMVPGVDPARANARMRWGIGTPDSAATLTLILDELVKQPFRSVVRKSASQAGLAYARVPSGADTCAFCRTLAGRGFVYESYDSARYRSSGGGKYHGDCDCLPVIGKSESDYPRGYDPKNYEQQYVKAVKDADTPSMQDILSKMREQQGIN